MQPNCLDSVTGAGVYREKKVPVRSRLLTAASIASATVALIACASGVSEKRFWTWFQANEASLFEFQKNQPKIFDQLSAEMHKIHPALTFEFGPLKDGRREFIISADGIKDAFPKVEALYAAAPRLPRWKFTKFRQRGKPLDIAYEGISVKADAVAVMAQPDGAKAKVTVFLPDYGAAAHQRYQSIAFLLLDRALGEYDVETRVSEVQVASTAQVPAEAYSLDAFPKAFDGLWTNPKGHN